MDGSKSSIISIHALLAESDQIQDPQTYLQYPFLSTLSLRRATPLIFNVQPRKTISIHALLAESDHLSISIIQLIEHFYPRSPCGERRGHDFRGRICQGFLSTLSLRRATFASAGRLQIVYNFYPRSPCGERQAPADL